MVKKINTFGATVKTLLQKGYSQSWIAAKLKVKRQKGQLLVIASFKNRENKKKKIS